MEKQDNHRKNMERTELQQASTEEEHQKTKGSKTGRQRQMRQRHARSESAGKAQKRTEHMPNIMTPHMHRRDRGQENKPDRANDNLRVLKASWRPCEFKQTIK